MQPLVPQLRPLGVIDQVDLALRLYRRHFVTLLGVVAVVQIPILILQTLYNVLIMAPLQQQQMSFVYSPASFRDPDFATGYWGLLLSLCGAEIGLFAMLLLVYLPLTGITMGATAYAVSEAYLGRTPTVSGAFAFMRAEGRWLRAAAGNFLVGLVATMLALIPCLGWIALAYLYVRWALVAQAIALENLGPIDGMRRSWHLVEGHMLRLLGLAILGWGISLVLSLTVTTITGWVFPMNPLSGQFSYALYYLIQSIAGAVGSVLYVPVFLGVLTVFYFDLRVRKEGYDLRLRADQLAAAPAA